MPKRKKHLRRQRICVVTGIKFDKRDVSRPVRVRLLYRKEDAATRGIWCSLRCLAALLLDKKWDVHFSGLRPCSGALSPDSDALMPWLFGEEHPGWAEACRLDRLTLRYGMEEMLFMQHTLLDCPFDCGTCMRNEEYTLRKPCLERLKFEKSINPTVQPNHNRQDYPSIYSRQ